MIGIQYMGLNFYKYYFLPKNGVDYRYDDIKYEAKLSMMRNRLTIYFRTDPKTHLKSPAALLREYLQLVSREYITVPVPSFEKDLEKYGIWNIPDEQRNMPKGGQN